jgi:hypothetical protein
VCVCVCMRARAHREWVNIHSFYDFMLIVPDSVEQGRKKIDTK